MANWRGNNLQNYHIDINVYTQQKKVEKPQQSVAVKILNDNWYKHRVSMRDHDAPIHSEYQPLASSASTI